MEVHYIDVLIISSHFVLHQSDGIEDFGTIVLPLFLCAIGAWLAVYFAIWKSVKSSGAVS